MYHLVYFSNLVAERLIVCSTNLMVTHLFHSDQFSKIFGSRQSEQTDSSQLEEADNQPNADVEQSSSQPASQSNTVVEEQRSSQLGQAASQPNAGVEQSSSQEGAHNGTVASVEQSGSEKEKYRLGTIHMLISCMVDIVT